MLNGSLAVDASVGQRTKWAFVRNERDRRYYSKYGLFNGVLHILPLGVEYLVSGELPAERDVNGGVSPNPSRVAIINGFFVLHSLVIALLLWFVSGKCARLPWVRAFFVLSAIYCTTLWHYLRFPLSEATQVGLFLLFWLFFLRLSQRDEQLSTRPRRDVYWAWFALFLLCQTRVADLFILPLFGLYVAWLAWESNLSWRAKAAFVLKTVVIPATLIIIAQGVVHFLKFGSPLLSGYHQFWEAPRPHTVWQVLYEFTLHPQWNFFVTFPVLILAVPGWMKYLGRHTAEAVFLLAVLLGMFDIVAPLPFWRGELAYGPRYFLYLLPVLSLPALYTLEWLANAAKCHPCHSSASAGRFPSVRQAHGEQGERQNAGPRLGALPLTETEYRFSGARKWGARVALGGVVAAAMFLAFAQFQVQRFGFFDWRGAFRNPAGNSPAVKDYFNYTPVPKICWDHFRCRDHLEDLPYYNAMARDKAAGEIEAWKKELLSHIHYSNLYWFPDINK